MVPRCSHMRSISKRPRVYINMQTNWQRQVITLCYGMTDEMICKNMFFSFNIFNDKNYFLYVDTHTIKHTHIYIYTYLHTYIHTFVHTHTHTYTHTYIHTHTHIHTPTTKTIHSPTHTHTHTHTLTYRHRHTYIYTYTQLFSKKEY